MATKPPDHIHISEREPDGSWEDCTWDTGLEWYRLVHDARKPATHTEAQLLRRASGEPATGGSNLNDLARGIKARYGTIVAARTSNLWATVGSRMEVANTVAVVQGNMKAFGPLHRLSKWDRNFDGAHAMLVMRYKGLLLWCDPEAPTSADVPVTITMTELHQFVDAFPGGQCLFGTIKNTGTYVPQEEPTVAQLEIVDIVPKLVSTGANSVWYGLDGKALPGTHPALADRFSPYAATGGFRSIYVTPAGGPKVLALVKPLTIKPIPATDTTPYSADDLAAAKVAGAKEGVLAEKSRLRTLLGL